MNINNARKWYSTHRSIYSALSFKVSEIIKEILNTEKIEYYTITNRAKDIDSFIEKAKDEKYKNPTDIKDLAGIRVITYVESEAHKASDIIKELFDINFAESVDKSKILGVDKVGYRSLHYIAKFSSDRCKLPEYKKFSDLEFEIQIRTILEHAWAEIEHDRNYKYTGVLPEDIKRRFAILAGVLELANREFDQISLAIDSYRCEVAEKTLSGDLDIEINSTALKEFLSNKFKNAIDVGLISHFADRDDEIIKELYDFNIKTLSKLDEIIPEDFEKNIVEIINSGIYTNFLGIVRCLMIIENKYNYFTKAWNKDWYGFSEAMKEILQVYGVNPEEIAEHYHFDDRLDYD